MLKSSRSAQKGRDGLWRTGTQGVTSSRFRLRHGGAAGAVAMAAGVSEDPILALEDDEDEPGDVLLVLKASRAAKASGV